MNNRKLPVFVDSNDNIFSLSTISNYLNMSSVKDQVNLTDSKIVPLGTVKPEKTAISGKAAVAVKTVSPVKAASPSKTGSAVKVAASIKTASPVKSFTPIKNTLPIKSIIPLNSVNPSAKVVNKQIKIKELEIKEINSPKNHSKSMLLADEDDASRFGTKTYKSTDVHDGLSEHSNTLDSTIDDDILNKDDLIYNKQSKESFNTNSNPFSYKKDFNFLPWTILVVLLISFLALLKFINSSKL
jgi:hypothetical protein